MAGKINAHYSEIVRVVLDQYESGISAELDELDERLRALTLDLKPFDQAILAAVLVKAEDLRDAGAYDVAFCELDGDLQPW